MTKPNVTTPENASPDALRKALKKAFEAMTEEDLETMRKLQRVTRAHVPEGESLSEDLINDRRKEGAV